jgi:hypothetical protein
MAKTAIRNGQYRRGRFGFNWHILPLAMTPRIYQLLPHIAVLPYGVELKYSVHRLHMTATIYKGSKG